MPRIAFPPGVQWARGVRGCVTALLLYAGLHAATGAAPAPSPAMDLESPDGQLRALRRIQCSATDGEPAIFYWNGYAYSRVPGEPDRVLFRVEGMNIRQCGPLAGAASPAEFRLVSREILLYEDPANGEVLRTWKNPWTGKTVDVIHVANDPVNGNYARIGRNGEPMRLPYGRSGDHWWLTTAVPLFYRNPLGGDYQAYVGGMYHVAELFNFFGSLSELADTKRPSVSSTVGWQRLSPWLPWMEMGDRAGMLYFHTGGAKVEDWTDISPGMRAEIGKNYPTYREPPPLDDARPNETSWTYFRKRLDEKRVDENNGGANPRRSK